MLRMNLDTFKLKKSRMNLLHYRINHRGLKLDGAIGQEKIYNYLKSENVFYWPIVVFNIVLLCFFS